MKKNKPDPDMVRRYIIYAATAIAFTIIVYLIFGVKYTLYTVIAATVLLAALAASTTSAYNIGSTGSKEKKRIPVERTDVQEKEKKLLIFYILTKLEKNTTVDMSEIAADLDISIYNLTDVIKFLKKQDAIQVIYPPMKSFPLIRAGDPHKSNELRVKVFNSIARKTLLGKPDKEAFAREVEEYLNSRKRS